MKKLINFYILLGLMLVSNSCDNSKDFFGPNPVNEILEKNAIKDKYSSVSALIGLYNTLQSSNYYGGFYPLISDAMGGNCSLGFYDDTDLEEIKKFSVTSANVYVENIWSTLYSTIENSNKLLNAITNFSGFENGEKEIIIASTKVIRALAHFDLLRYFGQHWDVNSKYGIPVILVPQNTSDKPVRKSVKEVYDFIISDLNEAENTLKSNLNNYAVLSGSDNLSINWLSKFLENKNIDVINFRTIQALLARVYLYKKDYTNAIRFADSLISNSDYSLLSGDVFQNIYNGASINESIFQLNFTNLDRSYYNDFTYFKQGASNQDVKFAASDTLNKFFQQRQNDIRQNLVSFSADENPGLSGNIGRTKKYRKNNTKDDPAFVIRLAEMYLIKAEAKGYVNNGFVDLNILRNARGLASINPKTQDEFYQTLFDEIKAEFNFEGHLYFDIARFGYSKSFFGEGKEFKNIFPIPLREINVNSNLFQNPNY